MRNRHRRIIADIEKRDAEQRLAEAVENGDEEAVEAIRQEMQDAEDIREVIRRTRRR